MSENVSAKSWGSSTFETAVENRSFRLIVVQASAFALFMIMSEAWTEFFTAIVTTMVPDNQRGNVWIALARAFALTIFCIFILFVMITIMKSKYQKSTSTLYILGRKFRFVKKSERVTSGDIGAAV